MKDLSKHGLRKPVFGVGINDIPDSVYYKDGNKQKMKDYYMCWYHMLERCYCSGKLSIRPTYINCKVCDDWLYLSKFKQWYDANYVNDWHLDKDIIVKSNKLYSPETCAFVPVEVNSFVTERTNHRGNCLIGVRKEGNKFRSYIHENGKQINLGSYFSEIEAHEKWKNYKHTKAKELVFRYPNMDSRVKISLMSRYDCNGIYKVI